MCVPFRLLSSLREVPERGRHGRRHGVAGHQESYPGVQGRHSLRIRNCMSVTRTCNAYHHEFQLFQFLHRKALPVNLSCRYYVFILHPCSEKNWLQHLDPNPGEPNPRVTPNLFKDLLPLSKAEKVFRQNFGSVLPFRDQRGRRHFLIIAGNWNPRGAIQ